MSEAPRIDADALRRIDRWWRAANYLSVGQIYLRANPLLEQPLVREHVKPRLLGHWGTTPGLNFVYAHLNRVIRDHDVDMIWIVGPGHGGPAALANTWLEGSYTERYPAVTRDGEGMERLFRQFSWPYGMPSHVASEVPGSIHEGGELGYSLSHAWGAVLDNPELVVACVIGDGEAETAALATSWHSNKFVDPASDGAVLPILHLNGWKIANPTLLARIGNDELGELLRGYGYEPHFVCGDDPREMHLRMATTLETAFSRIRQIQRDARGHRVPSALRAAGARTMPAAGQRFDRPRWPMIVLQSPKGWTGPDRVDGERIEGTWRAHQVPFAGFDKPEHLKLLERWMRSYRPEELFDEEGRPVDDVVALAPLGARRMGMNPHANGGELLVALQLPDFRDYALPVAQPGAEQHESTRVLGRFLSGVFERNAAHANFRLFGPDETASNRLDDVYRITDKAWLAQTIDADENLAPDGRVMEVLSENLLQGWLEGYLLTGRHGLYSSYEAFIHIVDSMLNQHAKWLKVTRDIAWRAPIASLNYLLTSHAWRQDHNGFSHQDPGFLDHVANKKADIARIYLPPDANCLLSVADHCLRSRNYVNVIVAGKQPEWQWLDIEAAARHCEQGAGVWDWAGSERAGEPPDVVLACAGDVPTMETLAATMLLCEAVADLRVRVVNVVDLMTLQPSDEHPHGLSHERYDEIFGVDRPVIFAFHGYPGLVHRLTYKRHNHEHLHVHGYRDEGTTTTPFDMVVLNRIDRFRLTLDAILRVPRLAPLGEVARERYDRTIERHRRWVAEHGEDLPEIKNWHWRPCR